MTSYPALRELAEKAVSGPWHNVDSVVVSDTRHEDTYSYGDTTPDRKAVAYCGDEIRHRMGLPFGDERDNNANFIAAANPTAILSILDKYDAALAEIDRLREALTEIDNWSRAYPLKVFPEPDFAKVRELLEAGGITLDAVSASNMRHVVEGVGKIASQALRSTP